MTMLAPVVLRGAVRCAVCRRKMQGQHSHGVAYYRCRFPQEYALANRIEHPRNVILGEDAVVDSLDPWLTQAFASGRRSAPSRPWPTSTSPSGTNPAIDRAEEMINAGDAKVDRYRAALDAGADPTAVTE